MDPPLDPSVAATIEKFIVASPFGAQVGIRCESIAEDHVRLRLPFRSEVTTLGDMVHGGAIGALVDVAATAAAWATPAAALSARGHRHRGDAGGARARHLPARAARGARVKARYSSATPKYSM